MNWIEGTLESLPVVWTAIEAICEVDIDKELLTSDFEVITNVLGSYGYFDDLNFQRNRTNDKLLGNDIAQLLIVETSDSEEFIIPCLAGFTDCEIVAVHIVPQDDIIGDDTDYCQLVIANRTKIEVLGTKTFTIGNDADAYEITDFGGINQELIEAGDVVTIEKDNYGSGMALPQFLLVIEWNLA